MTTEPNAELIQAYADAIWNKQELHRMSEFMCEDVELKGLGDESPIVGVDELTKQTATWLGIYSEVQMTVKRIVADADRVAWQWQLDGKISDPRLFSTSSAGTESDEQTEPATTVACGISISTFRDGRIAQEVTQSNISEFLGQLGYPPKQ